MRNYCESVEDAVHLLKRHGICPTRQRVVIARLLFSKAQHLSADDVCCLVIDHSPGISKATVYNTLNVLSEHGLIREVIAHPGKVYYDSNTVPHHHFYDVDSGLLVDISSSDIELSRMPALPAGMVAEGVDVIVRVRVRQTSSADC